MRPLKQPSPDFSRVETIMKEGVSNGVFPGAVLLVALEGKILYHEAFGVTDLSTQEPVTPNTVFDLASLTKPLATGAAIMKLLQDNNIDLQSRLHEVLSQYTDSNKKDIRILSLLNHTAGLPACRPYYKPLLECPESSRISKQNELLIHEALKHPPGTKVLYSDIGFMILKQVIEKASGLSFKEYVENNIYAPLGITNLFFMNTVNPKNLSQNRSRVFASTEDCPHRKKVMKGVVHDLNAFAAGGHDGHAGLFGTAGGVFDLVDKIYEDYQGAGGLVSRDTCRYFLKKHPEGRPVAEERALAFDTPSVKNSAGGRLFSKESIGHLGYTGTSFWLDLLKGALIILLTNRVHPSAANINIRKFRPAIHDAVMNTLGFYE